MIEVTITPQDYILSDLFASLQRIGARVMPKTFKAIKMAAKVICYTWKSYAAGGPIPGTTARVKNPKGGYASSIKIRQLSPLGHFVYSDSKIAEILEKGTKQYDMKKTHTKGKRSRKVKKTVKVRGKVVRREGDSYTIIPFRHRTPGALAYNQLPVQLYAKIRQEIKKGNIDLNRVIKGKKMSPNYEGELIPRAQYQQGSRISSGIDKLDGLIAADVSSPNKPRSAYMTFRVVSVNSPAHKWIQPARPALKLTAHVAENTKEVIGEMITQGIKEDLGMA